jgi:hypothetical protein
LLNALVMKTHSNASAPLSPTTSLYRKPRARRTRREDDLREIAEDFLRAATSGGRGGDERPSYLSGLYPLYLAQ